MFCGHFWPTVQTPDDRWGWLWSNLWNEDWQGKPKYSEKTCPSATLSTINPTNRRLVAISYQSPTLLSAIPGLSHKSKSKSKSHCNWQTVSKSWCRTLSGAHDKIFITVWQLRSCFCGAPSLTRGRVCLLYMLLALAVFLGSESLGTRDHILLSQI
jgi:hypothetical protein